MATPSFESTFDEYRWLRQQHGWYEEGGLKWKHLTILNSRRRLDRDVAKPSELSQRAATNALSVCGKHP